MKTYIRFFNIKKLSATLTVIWVVQLCAFAQVPKFTDKPEQYTATLKAQMASLGKPEADQLAQSIENQWNNGKITDSQKQKLISLTLVMQAKNYKASPQYLLFFDCLRFGLNAKHVNESQLLSFLDCSQRMVEKADARSIAGFWEKSRSFFYTATLYSSALNRLYLFNADYQFSYFDNKQSMGGDSTGLGKIEQVLNDGWDDLPSPSNAKTPEVPKPMLLATLAEGAGLDIKKADLVIATAQDSLVVEGIAAKLGFKENILLGEGGQTNWSIVGLDSVSVKLGNFIVDVRNPKITSPNTTLIYQNKLSEPIVGAFEFFSKRRNKNQVPISPKFVSNRNDIVIKNLGTDLDYSGGFSLVGKKIYSTSLKSRISTVLYKKDNKVLFKTTSNRFEIADSLLTAPLATITAFVGDDSLYHPGIKLELLRGQKLLRCYKAEKTGYKNANFQDGYHKMEINADIMRWYLEADKIDFYIVSGKRVVPALFESYDNFNSELYPSLTGTYGFNPMQVLASYFRSTATNFVYLVELATFTKKDVDLLKNAYQDMQERGMVLLDADEGLSMTRKGQHYVQTFAGKKDYDNFLIPSFYQSNAKDSTANASISLKDNTLTINGVKNFTLSDSLNTIMVPRDGKVVMHKDRSFTFNGKLTSKNFRFRGSNFYFDYDKFMVKMNQIDSITFVPQAAMKKGEYTEVGGNLRYEAGEIYINRPNNKSGRQKAPEYPKLVINSGLIVPFSQPERAGGVYEASKVFFKVPKIAKDSINSKDLEFAGTFYGGGLVPNFEEKLISMPDNSLGFVHKSNGVEKLSLYGSKSTISFKELKMDNKGLHAEAEFNHLRTTFKATDLVIYPDSLVAVGKLGSVAEGSIGQVYYPKVNMTDYSLIWRPQQDSLLVSTVGKGSFELYNQDTKLSGQMLVNKAGIFASGLVKRPDSEIESKDIKFEQNNILAKHALAKVGQNLATSKPVLMSYDVNFALNTKNNIAKFELPKTDNLEDTTTLYLPYSAYKTNINSAEWDIAKKQITMRGNVQTSTFTSLVPEQEGLAFNGSAALYDLASMSLNISGVPYIDVVDSRLKPAAGKVLVKKDGNMEKFANARLEIDSINAYHVLKNANIKVLSKNNYQGDGLYTYVNALGDSTQLKFASIEVAENKEAGLGKAKGFYTTAKASIQEKDRFMITPKIQYRGEISFTAGDPALSLEGSVKPFIKKRKDLNNWLTYKGKNTDGVRIEINDQLQADAGLALYAGWHYRSNGGGLYTSFLSAKEATEDQDLFLAKGALSEDAKAGYFEVSSPAEESQKYYYDDQKNVINLEGKFNLFAKTDYVQVGGTARIVPDSSIYKLNTMMLFNFPLLPEIQKAMANGIAKANLDNTTTPEPAEASKERLLEKVSQLIGAKAAAAYQTRSEFDYQPLASAAPIFASSIVFSDVDLNWNNKIASFYSVGKVGLGNIATNDINAQVNAFIEIRKNTDKEDELGIYIEPSDNLWYYLVYRDNKLGLLSSDQEFNNLVTAKETQKKEGEYSFGLIDELEKKIFIDNFRANYKVPKKPVAKKAPAAPPQAAKKPVKKEEDKEGF